MSARQDHLLRSMVLVLMFFGTGSPVAAQCDSAEPSVGAPSSREDRNPQAAEALVLAALEPHRGRTLGEVDVTCDGRRCEEKLEPVLRMLLRLDPGSALDPQAATAAWSRLIRTELFSSIAVSVGGEDQARLVFDGTRSIVVTELRVDYDSTSSRLYPKQFEAELRKRLLYRKGGNFPIDDGEVAKRQRENIEELYERLGFEGTRVHVVADRRSTDGKSVSVLVVVQEGAQDVIGKVLVSGNSALTYAEVVGPIETGERVDFWRGLFRFLGLGDFERRRFREELDVVEHLYRDRGYFAARVRLDAVIEQDNAVYPLVRIIEGPHVELRFVGNEAIDTFVLTESTTFAQAGAIDDTELSASVGALLSLYQAAGHYYARVVARRERLSSTEQRITFDVDEGPRVLVRTVEFVGLSPTAAEALRGRIETQGVGSNGVVTPLNVSSAILQDARMATDLLSIREVYRARGFPRLKFRCMAEDDDPMVWAARARVRADEDVFNRRLGRFDEFSEDPATHRCFQVERDVDGRLITVRVELDPGLQTTVAEVDFLPFLGGMTPEMADEAYELLERLDFVDTQRRFTRHRKGLDRQKVVSLEGFLLRWYRSIGYTFAEVSALCGDNADPKRACTEEALYGVHLERLRFHTVTGPQVIVGGILLRGNLETSNSVLRNELLFGEGRPLATDDLFRSQANLRSLGIFDSVKIETIGAEANVDVEGTGGGTSLAVVKVDVEESHYRFLEASTGLRIDAAPLSTDQLPLLYVLGAAIRDRNFWGTALEFGLEGEHGNRLENPGDVVGDDAQWAVRPYVLNRRFLGSKLSVGVRAALSLGRTEQRDQYEQRSGITSTVGYDFFNLSYPNTWGRGFVSSLEVEYARSRRRDLERRGEIPPFDDPVNELEFRPALTLDTRDNPLHPTRGLRIAQQDEIRFSSSELVPELIEPAFKETLTAEYVHDFFDRQLLLAPTLRLGAIQVQRATDARLRDFLFKAGGDGLAVPVRGYNDASIEACNGRVAAGYCQGAVDREDDRLLLAVGGRAMMGGTFELRFPSFIAENFWLAVFTDAAAIAPSWDRMSLSRLHASGGGGLRWLISGQIPLRLDLGFPFRETVFSPREPRLHLNIFYQF